MNQQGSNDPPPSCSASSSLDADAIPLSLQQAVARLPPHASRATVETALAPHLVCCCGEGDDHHSSSSSSSSRCCLLHGTAATTSPGAAAPPPPPRVLPLLWACCDRGQLHAVRFLLEQEERLLFHSKNGAGALQLLLLLDRHRHPETGNAAAHHAARSGSLALWKYLVGVLREQQQQQQPKQTIIDPAAASNNDDDDDDDNTAAAAAGPPPPPAAAVSETRRTREGEEIRILSNKEQSCSEDSGSWSPSSPSLRLLRARNHHGDTPLMMACVATAQEEAVELVEYMVEQLLLSQCCAAVVNDDSSSVPASTTTTTTTCCSILNARNQSNDSALSLACGHGNVAVVKLLLSLQQSVVVCIEDDDWVKARASLKKLEAVLRSMKKRDNNNNQKNESSTRLMLLESKRRDLQTCVTLVREALQRRADAVTAELLREEELNNKDGIHKLHSDPLPSSQQRRGKRKKKAKQGSNNSEPSSRPNTGVHATSETTVETLKKQDEFKLKIENENNKVVLTQLDDGTRAVAVPGISLEEDTEGQPLPPPVSTDTKSRPSPNDLLRWQAEHSDPAIRDQLQALGCWDDASRLLLTPHGFALECSPAQLDAVQAILERQLAAVQEARAIQRRLRATAIDCRDGTGSTNG